jgi:ketosteroid isomerase-like protein
MSEENVEVARRAFEAFNRTYAEGTPDLYEFLDPNVELVPLTALLTRTPYHGHDGVREWIEEMKRDWITFELTPERFLDVGGDRVLAIGSWRAQGRKGGVPLDFPKASWLNLTQWRKGKMVRMQTFTDRNEALKAAGLSE